MNLKSILENANASADLVRSLSTQSKKDLINDIADSIDSKTDELLSVNNEEVKLARNNGLDESSCDRLALDESRVKSMTTAARNVAQLDDPVGEILDSWKMDSGIEIGKVRVPLGVVAVIYENRPNVTLDSATICLMSGNVCVLRGSSGARKTNKFIVDCIHEAVRKKGLPEAIVTFVDDVSREGAQELMTSRGLIDVLIPRGGPSLIKAIEENATVPTIIDGSGNCHVYVDRDADLDMAEKIVVNSKTQRTSVCNACESLVVHKSVASEFVPGIAKALARKDVEIVGDRQSVELGEGIIKPAQESDFAEEFLQLKISVGVVEGIEDAIVWVNKNSSGHTESIVTDNPEAAQKFMNGVTSAVVMQNTSTRYTDGERFGFGAEIGISTQKLHARGPMALRELTTYQYRVTSSGSIV